MSQSKPLPRITHHRTSKAVLAAVSLGMVLTLSACDDGTGDTSDKGAGAAGSKAPSSEAPSSAAPGSPAGDEPMFTGWQTQTAKKHHFRYDVPAESEKWKVLDTGTAVSYTDKDGKPIVVMTAAANYREGGCASAPNPDA
ncbi:hypothetical protein KDA82_30785, partial [Streptomyces daliensis]|nr:hypothetical protein [Streptomyces daliensis]